MDLVHVILVDEDHAVNMKTFVNIDDQDNSGNEMAEEEFAKQVKNFNSDVTDEEIDVSLEDGLYSYNGLNIYILHSYPENIQQF